MCFFILIYLFWVCQFFVNIAFLRLNRVQSKYEKNLLEKIEVEWRIQLEISFFILYCLQVWREITKCQS